MIVAVMSRNFLTILVDGSEVDGSSPLLCRKSHDVTDDQVNFEAGCHSIPVHDEITDLYVVKSEIAPVTFIYEPEEVELVHRSSGLFWATFFVTSSSFSMTLVGE